MGNGNTDKNKGFAQDAVDCYAVPGSSSIIDMIDPESGLTCVYGKTAADVAAEEPGAVRMPIADWLTAKAARQHTPITWDETTEEQYNDMLEVLPPAAWIGGAFLVGEPDDHDCSTGAPRFRAYRHDGDRYLVASRPMTRAEFRAMREAVR